MSEYDAWAADYDDWSAHMTEDVAWYVELARTAAEPVVELAVGSGRVAVPIAAETGKRVIGIDASAVMLEAATARAARAGVELDLRRSDIRDFALEEPVELVICPFRSLLHLPTWADKRRVFERVAAVLRPDGRFAWNAFVYSPFIAAENHDRRLQHGESGLWEMSHHVPADNRIDVTAGGGHGSERSLSLWWVTRSEWEGLIDVAGLEVEALYGGFAREPFDEAAGEFVWIARKPA